MSFEGFSLLPARSELDSEIVSSNTTNKFLNDRIELNDQNICSRKTLNILCGLAAR